MIQGILTLLLFCLVVSNAGAQEQAFFAQHCFNRMLYNPSYAGERQIPGLVLHSRQQWLGWDGAPSSNMLMAHSRLKDKNAGLGISAGYERMGPVTSGGLAGIYSYSLQLNEAYRLVMGVQGEVRYHQLHFNDLQLVDQGDQMFSDEPGIAVSPNFGVGVHLTNDKYTINLSFPQFLNEKLSPFEGTRSEWSSIGRPVYLGADLKLNTSGDLEIVPSIQMALSKGRTPWIELASHFTYMDKMRAGILYRFDHTLGILISYQYRERVVIGYSYDISLGFPVYNPGTHEIFLGYNLPFNRFKTVSPRQF